MKFNTFFSLVCRIPFHITDPTNDVDKEGGGGGCTYKVQFED